MVRARLPVPLAVLGGAFGLYGWAVFAFAFRHDGMIGPRYNAPGSDWMVNWAAARLWLEGRLPVALDGAQLTQFLDERFAGWLRGPLAFHPWSYPPTYLLPLAPFAALPFGAAYAAFEVLSFAALAAALARFAPPGRRSFVIAAALAAPAASINVVTGQNAFLIAALLIAGIGWSAARPIAGGVLLGLAACKPQFALIAPVALVAAGRWRCLAAMAATAFGLALTAWLVVGPEAWRAWFALVLTPPPAWREWSILWGADPYADALVLGGSEAAARWTQLVAILVAAAAVVRCQTRPLAGPLRLAAFLAATALAAPHLQTYDMLLLALAALFFVAHESAAGLRPGDAALALALWVAPFFNPPRLIPLGFLTPFVTLLFLWRIAPHAARAPAAP